LIKKARTKIKSIPVGIRWKILDSPEYSNWYEHRNFLWPHGLLDYMVFLRHHEFPSPYLDWTKSIDVAAHCAFQDVDPDVDKSVAIFAFLDTHTGSLDLTAMKMGIIPATNKAFSAKLEKTKVTVTENKITSWAVEPTDGAGLNAILGQLGVKLPTVA
jgi:hypothetical protein